MSSSSNCIVCSRKILPNDRKHKCIEKVYALITKIIQPTSDSPAFLDNIANLVFQGGGVKGVAYLGALEQLQVEGNKRGCDFLGGVKRIAGTSAGSIVALYLGLNMSVAEITPLMERSYSSLLDDGLVLKVKIDKAWYDLMGLDHKNFKAKHIILHALKYFEDWSEKINKNPNLRSVQEKELGEAINTIFKYYGEKMGFIPSLAIKIKGSKYAGNAAKWLMDLLHPPKPSKKVEMNAAPRLEGRLIQKKSIITALLLSSPFLYHLTTAVMAGNGSVQNPGAIKSAENPNHPDQVDTEPRIGVHREEVVDRETSYVREVSREEEVIVKATVTEPSESASTIDCGSSVFDDIISRECSGFLSENDQLEVTMAENSRIINANLLSTTIPDRRSGYLDSYISGFSQRSQNPNLERIGAYADSHFSIIDHRSTASEKMSKTSAFYLDTLNVDIPQGTSTNDINRHYDPKTDEKLSSQEMGNLVTTGDSMSMAHKNDGENSGFRLRSVREAVVSTSIRDNEPFVLRNGAERSQNLKDVLNETQEPTEAEMKNVTKNKEEAAEEYLQRKRISIAAAPESELIAALLPAALGELLWFCIFSQQNAAGIQEQLGLFDGSVVKQELIEKPIMESLRKLNLEPKSNLTFKELMDYNSRLPEGKKFKQFYVTAFNTETSQTEVFSAEHTPNVVIADAVRASMSIPVFFTPVTIREKNSSGILEERSKLNGTKRSPVHYMDGGILDNYPLWIFDDIKYCFGEDFKCDSNTKFSIQNPNTLGFRLLDGETIEKYTNPNFESKAKTEEEKQFKETFSYQIGLLLNAVANDAQENEHIKRGDHSRSVYVNNNGVSAIAFNLTEAERRGLINSGIESIKNYQKRASQNFYGEGQIR